MSAFVAYYPLGLGKSCTITDSNCYKTARVMFVNKNFGKLRPLHRVEAIV